VLTSVGAARRFVADVLGRVGAGKRLSDEAVLLTSEVVTNALVHAGGGCTLTVAVDTGVVRVEVHDEDSTAPAARQAGAHDEGGRGLHLLDSLAWRWGSAPVAGAGKSVWFELARSSTPTSSWVGEAGAVRRGR